LKIEVCLTLMQVFWGVTLCHWMSSFVVFWRIVVPSSSGTSLLLLDSEDEGTAIIWNTGKCSPNVKMSCLRRLGFSATHLWEPHVSFI